MKWFTCVVCTALAILLISNVADLALTVLRYQETLRFKDRLQKLEQRLHDLPLAAVLNYNQQINKKLEDLRDHLNDNLENMENHLKKNLDEMDGHLNTMDTSLSSRANCISSEDIKGLLKNLLVPYS